MLAHLNRTVVVLLALSAALSGCGGNGAVPASHGIATLPVHPADGLARPDVTQRIYVASRNTDSVLGFAITADGNVAPTRILSGPNTLLGFPIGLAFSPGGHLDVMNDSGTSVLIFPKGAHGDVAPQVLGGSNVPITGSAGIAIDASGQIYVSDFRANAIYVFKSGAVGNVAPKRTITGPKTLLSSPLQMAFDSAGDLYVANYLTSTSPITEFAPNANGNAAPIHKIGGSHTHLVTVQGIVIDSAGRIVTGNFNGTSIEIFAAGAHGNVAPVVTIGGAKTLITNLLGVGVDASGTIYATNQSSTPGDDAILVFAPGAHGNAAPIAAISGSNTGMNGPFAPTVH